MFRYKRGIAVSYDRQMYIYAMSRNYRNLRPREQAKIVEMCRSAGGDCSSALFEFVTTDATATEICLRHYISSRTTLYRAVKKYYERWPRRL